MQILSSKQDLRETITKRMLNYVTGGFVVWNWRIGMPNRSTIVQFPRGIFGSFVTVAVSVHTGISRVFRMDKSCYPSD